MEILLLQKHFDGITYFYIKIYNKYRTFAGFQLCYNGKLA